MAYLESPGLQAGDKILLQLSMAFAVDGDSAVDDRLGGGIGDSAVTKTSGGYLTDYRREILAINH